MWINVGSMMYMSGEAPFIEFLTSQLGPFVIGDSIPTPFEHPYIIQFIYSVMFQCLSSATNSGPVLSLYCVNGMTVETS